MAAETADFARRDRTYDSEDEESFYVMPSGERKVGRIAIFLKGIMGSSGEEAPKSNERTVFFRTEDDINADANAAAAAAAAVKEVTDEELRTLVRNAPAIGAWFFDQFKVTHDITYVRFNRLLEVVRFGEYAFTNVRKIAKGRNGFPKYAFHCIMSDVNQCPAKFNAVAMHGFHVVCLEIMNCFEHNHTPEMQFDVIGRNIVAPGLMDGSISIGFARIAMADIAAAERSNRPRDSSADDDSSQMQLWVAKINNVLRPRRIAIVQSLMPRWYLWLGFLVCLVALFFYFSNRV